MPTIRAILAYRFAETGVAALIFDQRGVGQSSGDWQTARFEDLAADAATYPRLDSSAAEDGRSGRGRQNTTPSRFV